MSKVGSVCERGVVGRREEMLSSEALLGWRERTLVSLMLSVSSGILSTRLAGNVAAATVGSGREASVLLGVRTGVGLEAVVADVFMALRHWTTSSVWLLLVLLS
jgi:hypothetical protein